MVYILNMHSYSNARSNSAGLAELCSYMVNIVRRCPSYSRETRGIQSITAPKRLSWLRIQLGEVIYIRLFGSESGIESIGHDTIARLPLDIVL